MRRRLRRAAVLLLAALLPFGAGDARASGSAEAREAPAIRSERGEFRMKLPEDFAPLEGEELAGYEAAVLSDYPGAARTLLAAANPDRSAMLLAAVADSDADCLDAAREAADALLGYPDAARELRFGANRCAGFGCAVDGQACRLHFFSDGARILLVAVSGLDGEATEELLAGLRFG